MHIPIDKNSTKNETRKKKKKKKAFSEAYHRCYCRGLNYVSRKIPSFIIQYRSYSNKQHKMSSSPGMFEKTALQLQ